MYLPAWARRGTLYETGCRQVIKLVLSLHSGYVINCNVPYYYSILLN